MVTAAAIQRIVTERAQQPRVRAGVFRVLRRAKDATARRVAVKGIEAGLPGLIAACGVDPLEYIERGLEDEPAEPTDTWAGWADCIWSHVLSTVERGQGVHLRVKALGLDYDEFKRRAAAAA